MQKQLREFLDLDDVVRIAKGFISAEIHWYSDNRLLRYRILETEAYRGHDDRASHAWRGRPTKRTQIMFGPSGRSYIYLCYGIHHLLNVVTNQVGKADAVLIRAAALLDEHDRLLQILDGPGKLTRSMGLDIRWNDHPLDQQPLVLTGNFESSSRDVICSPRVGVDYAGTDALLPWRFRLDPQKG